MKRSHPTREISVALQEPSAVITAHTTERGLPPYGACQVKVL